MKKPNIVYVFADQLRYSAVGCNGNSEIHTPNFDRLAKEGMVFDQCFSSCPICAPYRAQVLSGRYPHQNGVVCNEYELRHDIPTLPGVLKQAGYHTAYVGKWHLGYGPYTPDKRYGFDTMAAYNINRDAFYGSYHLNEEGPFEMRDWHPTMETNLAIDFIRKHQQMQPEDPFFLMMSWLPPHWPYETFPKEYDIYDGDKLTISPNTPKQLEAWERRETAMYYGNVTGLDDQFGRLMKTLEELGLTENTIVCFTSDHGDHLGSHGYGKPFDSWLHHTKRGSKATPFNESIHIPFIMRWPGHIEEGTRTDAIFSSVDVMPTLLAMCEVAIPEGLAGKDLSFVPLGGDGERSDSVYLQILGPGWPHRGKWLGYWRGVRTDRYVYARWYQDEVEPMLFDVIDDPYEMNNLYGKKEYQEVQKRMETLLQGWLKETRDPFEYGERDPETRMLKLGQKYVHKKWENTAEENF